MYLINKNSLRFLKFLVAGGFGAICYITGAYILSAAGVVAWIASSIVFSSMIPIVYVIQKKFVFESDETHVKSFPRYFLIQLIGLGFSAIIPFFFAHLSISPTVSFLCVVFLAAAISYVLQLRWVFS